VANYFGQELVTLLAQWCGDLKKMEEQKCRMRDELVEGFNSGLRCPRRGPYLIVMTSQERRTISWKDECIKLAKEHFGKAWKKWQTRTENDAPVVNTPMLLPQVNPDYDVEEAAKAVAVMSADMRRKSA